MPTFFIANGVYTLYVVYLPPVESLCKHFYNFMHKFDRDS